IAEFSFDGENYRFHLRVDHGQMLEAAAHHIHGHLTEELELQMIRETIGSSNSLVEVGTLVGNHLIYFLKTLKPKKVTVFDFSERSIEACRKNVDLNAPFVVTPEIDFRAEGVGAKSGWITAPNGKFAKIVSLDEAIAEDVDFI